MKLLLYFILINVGVINCKTIIGQISRPQNNPDLNLNLIDVDNAKGAFTCAVLDTHLVLTSNRILSGLNNDILDSPRIAIGITFISSTHTHAIHTSGASTFKIIGNQLLLVLLSDPLPEKPALKYTKIPKHYFARPLLWTTLYWYYFKNEKRGRASCKEVRLWIWRGTTMFNSTFKGHVYWKIYEGYNSGVGNLVYKDNRLIGVVSNVQKKFSFFPGFSHYIVTVIDIHKYALTLIKEGRRLISSSAPSNNPH